MQNIAKYLPVLIIIFSLTIILGSTFAYFTNKVVRESNFVISKIELSGETTTGINGVIQDALPGTPLIDGKLQFSKSIDSEPLYVRAKLSFSLDSTYQADEGMQSLIDDIRNSTDFNIISTEQNGAVWSAKQGNYFYLLDSTDNTKLKRVDTIDTYVLSNEIVVPRDLEQLEDNFQYMKSINFHVAFEAIQADNVSDVLATTKATFNELFQETDNEKFIPTYTITYKGVDLTSNFDVVNIKGNVQTVPLAPPTHTNPNAEFVGWYTDSDFQNEFTFGTTINQNYTLYPKFVINTYITFSGTGTGNVTGMGNVDIMITLGSNQFCELKVLGTTTNASNYQYDASTKTVDLTLNFSYNGIVLNRFTGVFNNDYSQLTTVTFYGTNVHFITNNGSITLVAPALLYTFESYTTSAELQQDFDRWWNNSGSWQKDTTNADRLVLDTNGFQGNNCVKIRGYASGNYRLTLASDLDGTSRTNLSFWVKNNTGSSDLIQLYIYKSANLTNSQQINGVSIPSDNQWHYVTMSFSSASVYNFSILFHQHNSNEMYVDYISFNEIFIPTYTITYKGVDLTSNFDVVNIKGNVQTVPLAPPTHTNPNAEFVGWYTDSDFQNEFTFGTTINQNYTLYPKFVINTYITFSGTGTGNVTGMGNVDIMITLGSNQFCELKVLGTTTNASNYQYDASTKTVDLTLNFSYNGIVLNRFTGVFNNDYSQLTTVTFYGTNVHFITNNGSITLVAPALLYTFESYTTSAELQQDFDRWWNNSGSWQKDTTNADRLVLDTNGFQGNNCVKIRGYASGNYRLTLASDLDGTSRTNLSFWVKNNTGSSDLIQLYIYKSANLTNSQQINGVSIPSDNQWHYVTMSFSSASVYNFSILFHQHSSNEMYVDYISLN